MNLIIGLFSLVLTSFYPAADNGKINVSVSGIQNTNGTLVIDIFSSEEGFPMKGEKALKHIVLPINKSTVSHSIMLPKGKYAFIVYHDEDSNGELKTNFIGMPKEGLVISNNAKGFMGPPDFDDAKFELKDEPLNMSLALKYL